MPLSERLLRAVERRLLPWFDREAADKAMVHSEELRQSSIATRIEAEKVIGQVSSATKIREAYRLTGERLRR